MEVRRTTCLKMLEVSQFMLIWWILEKFWQYQEKQCGLKGHLAVIPNQLLRFPNLARFFVNHVILDFSITDGSPDILFAVFQPIQLMKEYPCELTSVPIDYRKRGNGLLFQKNWSYSKLINHNLFKVGTYDSDNENLEFVHNIDGRMVTQQQPVERWEDVSRYIQGAV